MAEKRKWKGMKFACIQFDEIVSQSQQRVE